MTIANETQATDVLADDPLADPEGAARRFKALADPARVRILAFLADPVPECCARDDAVCACDLEDVTGLSQPTVSHHMRILVDAGLVTAERRGRWMHYRPDPDGVARLRETLRRLCG